MFSPVPRTADAFRSSRPRPGGYEAARGGGQLGPPGEGREGAVPPPVRRRCSAVRRAGGRASARGRRLNGRGARRRGRPVPGGLSSPPASAGAAGAGAAARSPGAVPLEHSGGMRRREEEESGGGGGGGGFGRQESLMPGAGGAMSARFCRWKSQELRI